MSVCMYGSKCECLGIMFKRGYVVPKHLANNFMIEAHKWGDTWGNGEAQVHSVVPYDNENFFIIVEGEQENLEEDLKRLIEENKE